MFYFIFLQVQDAIARTVIGRTVLVIAHRLSTIRNVDKILVLQFGKIVEEGTHIQLLDKRGLYYQLVRRQTEQNETEIKTQSIENNKTTISIGVPLTEKIYSTSFNVKESI
jgi:ABC-type multidrug transport system ATPase subunit